MESFLIEAGKLFQLFSWLIASVAIVVGGVIGNEDLILIWGVMAGLLGLVVGLMNGERLVFPRGFKLFVVILLLGLLTVFWSEDKANTISFTYLMLGFASWWWWMHVIRSKHVKNLPIMVMSLGLVFAIIFTYKVLVEDPLSAQPDSLIGYASLYFNHIHIGDLWAVVLVALFLSRKQSKVLGRALLFLLGIILVFVSRSRSAIMAILVGLLIPSYNKRWLRVQKVGIVAAILIFIYLGSEKSILRSRPYFVQSVVGIFYYPLGVGMGNFAYISNDERTHLQLFSDYSNQGHSLIVEYISGMGVMGLIFLYWLVSRLMEVPNRRSVEYMAFVLFVVLTVNFLFDSTYMVPTMMWLWGGLLGLSQGGVRRG